MLKFLKKDSFVVSEKKLTIILFSLIVILLATTSKIIFKELLGDEPFYNEEVKYLAQYGLYNSLSQGSSFIYSLLVFCFSKIFFINFILSARILSTIFFLLSCILIFKIVQKLPGYERETKFFTVLAFFLIAKAFTWEVLPDFFCCTFVLLALYSVVTKNKYYWIKAAVFCFIAFACKPIAIFTVPPFIYLVFFSDKGSALLKRIARVFYFTVVFLFIFFIYHIPGYQKFGKLMLETKSHAYQGVVRVENDFNYNQINAYFLLYPEIHKKPNKWGITPDDVRQFKKDHPDVNLDISYSEFVTQHTKVWLAGLWDKFFDFLPYHILVVTFIAKYSMIGRFITSKIVIDVVAILLLCFFYFKDWKATKLNINIFSFLILYFVLFSIYVLPQLEDNWFMFFLPLMALPVINTLCKNFNILILFAIQFAYCILVVNK